MNFNLHIYQYRKRRRRSSKSGGKFILEAEATRINFRIFPDFQNLLSVDYVFEPAIKRSFCVSWVSNFVAWGMMYQCDSIYIIYIKINASTTFLYAIKILLETIVK